MKRDNSGFWVLGIILLGVLWQWIIGLDYFGNRKIQIRMDELCANEAGIYVYKTVVVPDT